MCLLIESHSIFVFWEIISREIIIWSKSISKGKIVTKTDLGGVDKKNDNQKTQTNVCLM